MARLEELLRDADPLRNEPMPDFEQQVSRRAAVLAATPAIHGYGGTPSRSSIVAIAAVVLAAIVVLLAGTRGWPLFVSDVHAAVRFEVRLAEDQPAPGLRQAKVAGTDKAVYLHDGVVVSNSDIAAARLVQESSQYGVDVRLTASGAKKMRAATEKNIGKLMAILLDGQVVMAPVIRSPIDSSALITGDFTREEAQRIANGLSPQ
jgi:hypothetical protein